MQTDYTVFMQHDLTTQADLETLLRHFYTLVFKDPIIGYLFVDVAKVDLEAHIPTVASFWSDQLLISQGEYSGELFKAHLDVHSKAKLRPGHFTRWLHLLDKSVVECGFSGPKTNRLLELAQRIAKSMNAALNSQKRNVTKLSLKEML